ncbi:hypothetical protein WKI65_32645 [Streptomyces sp. MS1.AVA.3]|uniref:hypothetical protein n=1 Tax=Streptomyces decoyicus TaxID=249567 RepID=UPI0030C3098E
MKIISECVAVITLLPAFCLAASTLQAQAPPPSRANCRESFSKVWILPQSLHMFVVPRRAPRPAADGMRSHMQNA